MQEHFLDFEKMYKPINFTYVVGKLPARDLLFSVGCIDKEMSTCTTIFFKIIECIKCMRRQHKP